MLLKRAVKNGFKKTNKVNILYEIHNLYDVLNNKIK